MLFRSNVGIGKSTAAQRGPVYSDSDVYKWTEAASFALQSGERSELHAAVDNIAKDMMAAQQPDGYLNTYYIGEHASQRMEPKVQQWGHELYNMGHFLQGATAYYRATGDRALLDAGIRFVNEFLLPNFGAGADKKPLFSGHPEMELALVELYRMTGDKRQLDLAGYLLAGDPRIHVQPWDYVYHFCGTPFTSRTHLEGHAVRATLAAGRPTITWKPAIRRIGKRSTFCGRISLHHKCTSPAELGRAATAKPSVMLMNCPMPGPTGKVARPLET